MHVLLIDNNLDQAAQFAALLGQSGVVVSHATSPGEVAACGMPRGAAAVLLDNQLAPAPAGAAVQALRQAGVDQPLFVLAARGTWRDKVECIDAGADDFLLKPVRVEEILARLRAILRRSTGAPAASIQLGGIDLDIKTRCAWLNGRCLNLTQNEFQLLHRFMLNPGAVIARADVIDRLTPREERSGTNAVEALISRLRRKIGTSRITTVRGIGYRFEAGGDEARNVERASCGKEARACCAATPF